MAARKSKKTSNPKPKNAALYARVKAEGKKKFRGPAAMFAKIFHDYLDFQAKKHKKTKENYIKQLLMNEVGK